MEQDFTQEKTEQSAWSWASFLVAIGGILGSWMSVENTIELALTAGNGRWQLIPISFYMWFTGFPALLLGLIAFLIGKKSRKANNGIGKFRSVATLGMIIGAVSFIVALIYLVLVGFGYIQFIGDYGFSFGRG